MTRSRLRELLLCLIPFAATVCTVGYWDRAYPRVLGLPFNLFWVSLWCVLTSVLLALIEFWRKRP